MQNQKIEKNNCGEFFLDKIERGLNAFVGKKFLHTSPHHDDIMLGYLPFISFLRDRNETEHYFATATPGSNGVKNEYLIYLITVLEKFIDKSDDGALKSLNERDKLISFYLEVVRAKNEEGIERALAANLFFTFKKLYLMDADEECFYSRVKKGIEEVKTLSNLELIRYLKGSIREFEEEILWGSYGFSSKNSFSMKLGFYFYFEKAVNFERDTKPLLNLLERLNPDILTVAIDPQNVGPDTHYKTLLVVKEAVRIYLNNNPDTQLEILGYRNVWHRFAPEEANMYVPVSSSMLKDLSDRFCTCFKSQINPLFPATVFEGEFSDVSKKIMVEQFSYLKTKLGMDFFSEHLSERVKSAEGFIFLRLISSKEFLTTIF